MIGFSCGRIIGARFFFQETAVVGRRIVEIEISLFSAFRLGRFDRRRMKVPEASTVSDMLTILEIPVTDVGVLVINGRDGTLDQNLLAGDRVTLIPAIGGG